MGLDMYLRAERYISGWEHANWEERERFASIIAATGVEADPESPSLTVRVTVGYWRKANAIHRWFVEKVQNGQDDCGDYGVTREQLVELRETCERALAAAHIAEGQPVHNGTTYRAGQDPEQHFVEGRAALNGEALAAILPTQPGFFFGPTDYDEWYIRNLEETVRLLDRVLTIERSCFYYHSSW